MVVLFLFFVGGLAGLAKWMERRIGGLEGLKGSKGLEMILGGARA